MAKQTKWKERCAHRIFTGARTDVGGHPCPRLSGHGPGGKYCGVHAPRYEKVEARVSLWRVGWDGIPEEEKVRSISGNLKSFIDERGRRKAFKSRYGAYYLTEKEALLNSIEQREDRRLSALNEVREIEADLRDLRTRLKKVKLKGARP